MRFNICIRLINSARLETSRNILRHKSSDFIPRNFIPGKLSNNRQVRAPRVLPPLQFPNCMQIIPREISTCPLCSWYLYLVLVSIGLCTALPPYIPVGGKEAEWMRKWVKAVITRWKRIVWLGEAYLWKSVTRLKIRKSRSFKCNNLRYSRQVRTNTAGLGAN